MQLGQGGFRGSKTRLEDLDRSEAEQAGGHLIGDSSRCRTWFKEPVPYKTSDWTAIIKIEVWKEARTYDFIVGRLGRNIGTWNHNLCFGPNGVRR